MRASRVLRLPPPPINVVLSLSTSMRLARPRSSSVARARLRPSSSLMTLAPVSAAMSCSIALRRAPKPGALTAQVLMAPRTLLITSVASASLSMSSAITNKGWPDLATASSSGTSSLIDDSRRSHSRMCTSSSTAEPRSALLMK